MPLDLHDSDRALLDRRFDVDDPLSLPNLVAKIEFDDQLKSVLFRYDVNKNGNRDAEKVHCAHCASKRHWRGWALLLEDNKTVLVGKDCGNAQFGLEFNEHESRFSNDLARSEALRWLIGAEELLNNMMAEIDLFLRHSDLSRFSDVSEQLTHEHGYLSRVLGSMIRANPGRWVAEVKVRDYAAERTRLEELRRGLAQSGNHNGDRSISRALKENAAKLPPIWNIQNLDVGSFAECYALLPPKPTEKAVSARSELNDLYKKLSGSSSIEWRTIDIKDAQVAIRKANEKFEDARLQINLMKGLWSKTSMKKFEQWIRSDHRLKDRYSVQGQSLIDHETGKVLSYQCS